MSETQAAKILENNELNATQVQDIAGGGLCSAEEIVNITSSLIKSYENLVDFASHVMGRVAGES